MPLCLAIKLTKEYIKLNNNEVTRIGLLNPVSTFFFVILIYFFAVSTPSRVCVLKRHKR